MTPLPTSLGGNELVAWRLDRSTYAAAWDSGEGAYLDGGRWNGRGVRAVYCSIDPATAILEVAVHKGFEALDTVSHVLTAIEIGDPSTVRVVNPVDIPNPNWLRPGIPSAGQQAFGDRLLAEHKFIVIPSAVSIHSWNLIFVATQAIKAYSVRSQERFALDTRLHPGSAEPRSPKEGSSMAVQRDFPRLVFERTAQTSEVEQLERLHRWALGLPEGKCRWPVSAPGAADFAFCGKETIAGYVTALATRGWHTARQHDAVPKQWRASEPQPSSMTPRIRKRVKSI